MGTEPRQPNGSFSGLPFDEAELLAYVEGELPAERQRELLAFLEARPDLRRTLSGMRRDRLILSEVGDAGAPEGLLEEALAVLERESLFGGEGGVPEAAPTPIVKARSSRRVQVFAMAAGFVLIAGGASYWISALVKPATSSPVARKELARADSAKSLTESKIAANDAKPPAVAPSEADAPRLPVEKASRSAEVLVLGDAQGTHEGAVAGRSGPSGIGSVTYPVATILPERAVELALEGRLAIYLSPRGAIARHDTRSGETYTDVVGPQVSSRDYDLPSSGPLIIEVPATASAMIDLFTTLSDGFAGDVTFEELPEPYDGAAAAPDDEITRFFDGDFSGPRVTVPVVIEESL